MGSYKYCHLSNVVKNSNNQIKEKKGTPSFLPQGAKTQGAKLLNEQGVNSV